MQTGYIFFFFALIKKKTTILYKYYYFTKFITKLKNWDLRTIKWHSKKQHGNTDFNA